MLLLAGGNGGGFAPRPPGLITLTSSPNGGNNPWMVPGAIRLPDGRVIGGLITGDDGDVRAFVWDPVTETATVYTIHAALEVDAHSPPALLLTSAGDLLAMFTRHNGVPIYIKVLDPDNPSSWAAATAHSLDAQLGGFGYTDLQLYEASDGTLRGIGRDEPTPGTDSRWFVSSSHVSTPTTWSSITTIIRIPSQRCYPTSWKAPGSDLIHLACTNGSSSGFTKIGHFRLNALTLAKTASDGSSIGASPLNFGDMTEAYSGGSGTFPSHVAIDVNGRPVVVGFDGMNYFYRRWNGSAWVGGIITSAGTGYEYNGPGTGFQPWGIMVDDGDPNTVWLAKDTGGTPHAHRMQTSDLGTSWSDVDVGDLGDEVQTLVPVRNPAGGNLRGFAAVGPWTHYNTYLAGLVGFLKAA